MQAMVPNYVTVWYDYKATENIFSFTNFANNYKVNYDSHNDDDFTVHTNRGVIKFREIKKGCMYSISNILQKNSIFSHQWSKIW